MGHLLWHSLRPPGRLSRGPCRGPGRHHWVRRLQRLVATRIAPPVLPLADLDSWPRRFRSPPASTAPPDCRPPFKDSPRDVMAFDQQWVRLPFLFTLASADCPSRQLETLSSSVTNLQPLQACPGLANSGLAAHPTVPASLRTPCHTTRLKGHRVHSRLSTVPVAALPCTSRHPSSRRLKGSSQATSLIRTWWPRAPVTAPTRSWGTRRMTCFRSVPFYRRTNRSKLYPAKVPTAHPTMLKGPGTGQTSPHAR